MTRRASADEQVTCLVLSVLLWVRYISFGLEHGKGSCRYSVDVSAWWKGTAQAANPGDREQDEKAGEMTLPWAFKKSI